MRIPQTIFFLLAFITTIHAVALPDAVGFPEQTKQLFKRKGGGGGGGKGGGGGGSSGSRGSSSSGSSGSSGSRLTSSTSNDGGRTSSGSGPGPRTYSSGAYYGGGAAAPYKSGNRSPGGVAPYFLGGAALGFFPGIWLYGAYAYSYPHTYYYHNDTSGQNETHPASCYCAQYAECGCESNNDTEYIQSVANNNTISHLANVNGTDTLVINGTLPNGTTAAGAAASFRQGLAGASGWWVVIAGVVYTIWFM